MKRLLALIAATVFIGVLAAQGFAPVQTLPQPERPRPELERLKFSDLDSINKFLGDVESDKSVVIPPANYLINIEKPEVPKAVRFYERVMPYASSPRAITAVWRDLSHLSEIVKKKKGDARELERILGIADADWIEIQKAEHFHRFRIWRASLLSDDDKREMFLKRQSADEQNRQEVRFLIKRAADNGWQFKEEAPKLEKKK